MLPGSANHIWLGQLSRLASRRRGGRREDGEQRHRRLHHLLLVSVELFFGRVARREGRVVGVPISSSRPRGSRKARLALRVERDRAAPAIRLVLNRDRASLVARLALHPRAAFLFRCALARELTCTCEHRDAGPRACEKAAAETDKGKLRDTQGKHAKAPDSDTRKGGRSSAPARHPLHTTRAPPPQARQAPSTLSQIMEARDPAADAPRAGPTPLPSSPLLRPRRPIAHRGPRSVARASSRAQQPGLPAPPSRAASRCRSRCK